MADGSPEERAGPSSSREITFAAPGTTLCDLKSSAQTFEGEVVNLSLYNNQELCEKSGIESRGVAVTRVVAADSRNPSQSVAEDADERKKRCIDRYDSSESSDSGVAVLSPEESDVASPRSPRSPESACSSSGGAEEGSARMPPWVSESAPAARRLAVQPAPARRAAPPAHRRITEFFNHRMKPHQGLKRDHAAPHHDDDTKKKCLPKTGVTQDLEKYISYLSQTLSPKVLKDVGRQAEAATTGQNPATSTNGAFHPHSRPSILGKKPSSTVVNGLMDYSKPKSFERVHTTMNGFMEMRQPEPCPKEKQVNGYLNGLVDNKKHCLESKNVDPSANGISKHAKSAPKGKVPIPALPTAPVARSPIKLAAKPDNSRMNGVVSSTTKLDSRMNGVMCGSNNLSLSSTHKNNTLKRELSKKSDTPPSKRTNRKSSACIANSKNLTWSKANNLKQVQQQQQQLQQKQNHAHVTTQTTAASNISAEVNSMPKLTVPNGVRQMSMTVNGNLANINMPVNNLQNCHQLNIPQPCNGTVTSNNLTSFVAVPHNVMLTTLRIPQNGIPAQTLTHQNNINNMASFNRPNVNVSSPTKLNGQFVFPLMQNINGTVVQIPNLMAKMPNFVLPQTPQMAPRQDHLQSPQHTAQILINGTLLKLANTMPPPYQNVNKTTPITSQPVPPMNKNLPGVPTVGMTVQQKPNYAVNFSHQMLMPQTGFIVTSVPNMNVKETWSYTGSTATTAPSSCANPIVNHPPPLLSFTNQALHPSSIPIAPVKPPDNPIQGTDPPSSTVKEPETTEVTTPKCDIPWLSKTVNNNIVELESSKISTTRPFSQVSSTLSEKIEQLAADQVMAEAMVEKTSEKECKMTVEEDPIAEDIDSRSPVSEELRKVEEVARREETIFTQITVLKDVSSNVHSTVIEANFASETTESESGIGTDKSIDSPSDSQASKECDEDSSLSLSVSVCSIDVPSQKSPILKQPKTLRFPPRNPTKAETNGRRTSSFGSTVVVCLWENCNKEFEGDPDLLEHLQSAHVESQVDKETYVCLWQQCKVRGKPSCSRHWLEKHTLAHGGNKPFKCIFDGCERRFTTQTLLERHLNHHFNETSPGAGGGKKSADSSTKLIRRNGKKLRYRRQPWSARMFDFFDRGMMEGLAWRLWRCTRWRLGGGCPLAEPRGRHTLTLHAALQASRYNQAADRREALVTYYPPHVLEDEWIPEKEVTRIKRVEIADLPVRTKVLLYEQFCMTYRRETVPRPEAKPAPPAPTRLLPARNCASSRVLNNLIAKQRKSVESKPACDADNRPLLLAEDDCNVVVSGAKKRKMGRRYGGNSFWPCGR